VSAKSDAPPREPRPRTMAGVVISLHPDLLQDCWRDPDGTDDHQTLDEREHGEALCLVTLFAREGRRHHHLKAGVSEIRRLCRLYLLPSCSGARVAQSRGGRKRRSQQWSWLKSFLFVNQGCSPFSKRRGLQRASRSSGPLLIGQWRRTAPFLWKVLQNVLWSHRGEQPALAIGAESLLLASPGTGSSVDEHPGACDGDGASA
jgi:hypothetical protein